MLGLIGTLGVIAQMAAIATGLGVEAAMTIGLFACVAWVAHSIKQRDGWLLMTNIAVGGFALWGLS